MHANLCDSPDMASLLNVVHKTARICKVRISFSSGTCGGNAANLHRSFSHHKRYKCSGKTNIDLDVSHQNQRIALLIDGDIHGASSWRAMVEMVREKGTVVHTCVFGAPKKEHSNDLESSVATGDISFITVQRKTGGKKDPNDIAIGMEAARVVSGNLVQTVALAVADADFLYVARRLKDWGCKTILLVRSNANAMLASSFAELGTDVMVMPSGSSTASFPKMKAVLHKDGESTIEFHRASPDMDILVDEASISDKLLSLGYLDTPGRPIIPAIAKFYRTNGIGSLTVWPPMYPRREAYACLAYGMDICWKPNSGAFVYIFPASKGLTSQKYKNKYGSLKAAQMLHAGGPFLCNDSAELPEFVLRRLGYMDDYWNHDLEEAIEVFCNATLNRKSLEDMFVEIPNSWSAHSKKALLHGALVSPRSHGNWQVAPKDTSIRQYLVAHNMISKESASQDEVYDVLSQYARRCGIAECKTYNKLVSLTLHSLNPTPPTARK